MCPGSAEDPPLLRVSHPHPRHALCGSCWGVTFNTSRSSRWPLVMVGGEGECIPQHLSSLLDELGVRTTTLFNQGTGIRDQG